jgi:hypothetical protein
MVGYGRYGRGPGGHRGSRTTAFRYRSGAGAARAGALFKARGRSAMARGRFAGYYRRSGYYGRFQDTGAEMKFHDVDVDDAAVATNGSILNSGSVNLIAQGVTESTRVGRKAVIRSINWRWNLKKAATTAGSNASESIRLILYLDKQCNGAAAGVTDILESDNYQSFNNLANKGRFKILMDKEITMNALSGGGDGTTEDYGAVERNGSYYKKCSIPIEFSSTTGAITEIRSNNLGVLILSKNGTSTAPVFDSKMRLRFTDG